ncbi:MAG: Npun_R2821/Npun_R2822 family protein [Cyanophyceae cyanobacterium]
MDGIYILGNDVVFDQVIALINSIQAHNGDRYPICVLPYNEQVERLKKAVANYDGVSVLEDETLFNRWDDFVTKAWEEVASRYEFWNKGGTHEGIHRMGTHRRFIAFDLDAPFERFLYLDADTITLLSLEDFFQRLDANDFITYDFQYKDPSHVFNMDLEETRNFLEKDNNAKRIFCSGMFASKAGLIGAEDREKIVASLKADQGKFLYPQAPDQTLLNYISIILNFSYSNLSLDLPKEQVTGCCVTSKHFEEREWRLYDKGNPLTYLHYIGLSSKLFGRLCGGENIDFPYRDVFLHYRYLKTPSERPEFTGKPVPYNAPPGFLARVKKKVKQKLGI